MMDLVISDIHADIDGLNTILYISTSKDFIQKYGEISRIINLGDILERGTHPKQVLEKFDDLKQNYPIVSVMGNHDEAFLYNRMVSGSSLESLQAHSSLSENDLSFFQQNKNGTYGQQEYVDKKNRLMCVHGGPIDPEKIIPAGAGEESWLYQKSWQRLSEEGFEFFSYAGYHYRASSAFKATKTIMEDFVILCGHQHEEAILKQEKGSLSEILSSIEPQTEKISEFIIEKKEIPIMPSTNYFVRIGLGGPEGYYGAGKAKTHFGVILDNPRKVILFGVISN